MLLGLCGALPPSLWVWACPLGTVTGETAGSVASPQKSSELNKPPISFHSVCVLTGSSKRSSSSIVQKRRGSCFTKLFWQCANLPFQLLDWTVFISSPPSLSSFSHQLSCCVQPLQMSSCCALLVIYQPKWHCGLYYFVPVHVSVVLYCCSPTICFWVFF